MADKAEKENKGDQVEDTPLPWGPLVWVCLVQFLDAFSTFLVIPFIPFMIKDFFPDLDKSDVGFYSGYMNSASFVGQLLGSPIWGILSDKFGRKPILLSGTLGTILSITLFAFSKDYYQAVLARFLWGFLNGNIGVVKTYVSEITDETNIAKALGMVAMQYGFGSLLGPPIGGFLANPTSKYAFLADWEIFATYKYALPCLIPWTIACGVLVGITFFLPESRTVYAKLATKAPAADDKDKEGAPLVEAAPVTRWEVLKSRKVYTSVGLYAVMGGVQIGFSSIFPIWVINTTANGGFNLESSDIGLVMSASGPVQLIWQPFVVPYLTKLLGFRRLFQCTAMYFASLVFFAPFAASLAEAIPSAKFPVLIFIWLSFTCSCNTGFSTVFVLLANSAPKRLRGTVNGLAQTCVAGARITGPAIFSNVFAWSLDNTTSWPMSHHLVFHILGLIGFCNTLFAFTLPASIQRPLPETVESLGEVATK